MSVQKTRPSDYPQAVIKQIEQLAQNIVIARKRRKETQAQWARKLGVSQPTMARIEKGDPAVAMASYVMCMWLINPNMNLADLIAPQNDLVSLEREISKIRARRAPAVSASKAKPEGRSVDQHAPSLGVSSAAELARINDLGRTSAEELVRMSNVSSAAELAKSLGGSSAHTAAGLAALLSQAQGKSK